LRRLAAALTAAAALSTPFSAGAARAQAAVRGVQICVNIPAVRSWVGEEVTISGYNQDDVWSVYHDSLWRYGSSSSRRACSWGWWWKGRYEVRAAGGQYSTGDMPAFDFGDVRDVWLIK
jgi:hypothetical protein